MKSGVVAEGSAEGRVKENGVVVEAKEELAGAVVLPVMPAVPAVLEGNKLPNPLDAGFGANELVCEPNMALAG